MTNNLGDFIMIQRLHSVWKRAGKRTSCRDVTAHMRSLIDKEYWYRWSRFLNAGYIAFLKLKSAWKIYEMMEMLGYYKFGENITTMKQNWRKNTTYAVFE